MTVTVTHATAATGVDSADGKISKNAWNEGHVVAGGGLPLDRYAIDGTYGTHFNGAALPAMFTRRNFTSGAESYQLGPESTYLRVQTASRTAGDGYYTPAPAGDWTFATKMVQHGLVCSLGLGVVDTAGTGVTTYMYSVGSPFSVLLTGVTTYTGYGGSYVQPGVTGTSPNLNSWTAWPIDEALWISLRKSGTNYYVAVSRDGELWGPDSAALAWAGTVDRIALMFGPLGNVGSANSTVDVDWLNKIA